MILKTFSWIAFSLALLAAALYYAPFFLIVSDQPVKSDAVVLFLGGEKGTREKEANQLLRDGFADYLIIPAYRQIKKQSPDGKLERLDLKLPTSAPNQSNQLNKPNQWNRFVEDTHQEAVIARDMMARMGISSAILVSSPYHMRRIKLIAGKVFGSQASFPPFVKEGQGGFKLYSVPTRYETPNEGFWLFNNYERKFVLNEYMKIGWFLLYSPFV